MIMPLLFNFESNTTEITSVAHLVKFNHALLAYQKYLRVAHTCDKY